jgi:hypothetical protein
MPVNPPLIEIVADPIVSRMQNSSWDSGRIEKRITFQIGNFFAARENSSFRGFDDVNSKAFCSCTFLPHCLVNVPVGNKRFSSSLVSRKGQTAFPATFAWQSTH